MNTKEAGSLLVSGLAIAGGVIASVVVGDPTATTALIVKEGLSALAGLGTEVAGTVFDNCFLSTRHQDDILKNGDLTRAIGNAVFKLCGQLAEDTIDKNDKESLQDLTRTPIEVWENLILGGEYEEGYGLTFSDIDLDEVSAERSIQYFGAKAENLDQIKTLTPGSWQSIIDSLCRKQDCSLSQSVNEELAQKLYDGFARALRKVLIDDFAKDGRAFASMQFRLLSEILNETKGSVNLSGSVHQEVVKLSEKIDAINLTAPRAYLPDNTKEWTKIFTDFDSFHKTLDATYEKTKGIKSDTELIKTAQAEQGETLKQIEEFVTPQTFTLFDLGIPQISDQFLSEQKDSDGFNPESFYLANYPAQWWGILNGFDEKTRLFHDVKRQIEESFYYDAPIVAYLKGSGGTGKTTLARQLVVDFVLNEKSYDCWWIEGREFEAQELIDVEKHLNDINESRSPTLFVLDDWSKFDGRTKSAFNRLFQKLNKESGNLKFVITNRRRDDSHPESNLLSGSPYSFDRRPELDVDNKSILQKVFDICGNVYEELSERLFSEDEVSAAKPFFLLYVLIRAAKDSDLLRYLSKETKSAERYFKEIVEFDLKQLSIECERKGLVSAIGFFASLKKKHNYAITKESFLLLSRKYSSAHSTFDLLNDYGDKPVKQWRVVGQYLYLEQRNSRARDDSEPDRLMFNKDDFVDAILEANVFAEFHSISDYVNENESDMSRFLIDNGGQTSASLIARTFCSRGEILRSLSPKIIQKLLDRQNCHHAYTKIFLFVDYDLVSDEQKWIWIEQYLGFNRHNNFFQRHCVMWLNARFQNDKQNLLISLKKLKDLGAEKDCVVNSILKASDGEDRLDSARVLLQTSKSASVMSACLGVLKNEPDVKVVARNLLETNKAKEVICACLKILKDELDAKTIARELLDTNRDFEIICSCLELLRTEPDIQEIARDLLETNKDNQVITVCLDLLRNESDVQEIARGFLELNRNPQVIGRCLGILRTEPDALEIARGLLETSKDNQVINVCLDLLRNESDVQEIARDFLELNKNPQVIGRCLGILRTEPDTLEIARGLLETNKDSQVISVCLDLLRNESDVQEIARGLLETNKDNQVISVCLDLLRNESDAQEIARGLLSSNDNDQVACVCLGILKDSSDGKEYAGTVLNNWKGKAADLVVRALESLAGSEASESVTKEIINNRTGKAFYLYTQVVRFGHGNYHCWQNEVKRVIKNWWRSSELVVGHCLRHSEDNYFETQNVCEGYLEEWNERIRSVKRKEKPVFYFMTKSLAHPYLRKEAKETALEMLEFEKNNKGFLPDAVKLVAEDIVVRDIFPDWHTRVESTSPED